MDQDVLFIGYPKCSTCQKAEKFLRAHGCAAPMRDIKAEKPMTEEEQYAVLASDGMLVKRPLLITKDRVLTGFREKEWAEIFA